MKVAQTVVPVHLIRSGLRWVQLYDPISHSDRVSSDYLLTRLLLLVGTEPLSDAVKEKTKKGGLFSNGLVKGLGTKKGFGTAKQKGSSFLSKSTAV
jgi:hypothetical protein